MWYDDLPDGAAWTNLMSRYVRCNCGGITRPFKRCEACGVRAAGLEQAPSEDGSTPHSYTFAGAEERIEDYQLLALMEREWKREAHNDATMGWMTTGMSQRASVVILFWTYYETRINRLITLGAQSLPKAVSADLLKRYDSVTSHTRALYQILFGTTYLEDLVAVGAEDIGGHLSRVQKARNEFVHGHPSAISDELVEAVVRNLEKEHEAWVRVLNRRVASSRATSPT